LPNLGSFPNANQAKLTSLSLLFQIPFSSIPPSSPLFSNEMAHSIGKMDIHDGVGGITAALPSLETTRKSGRSAENNSNNKPTPDNSNLSSAGGAPMS
jgi:hypothetical protein